MTSYSDKWIERFGSTGRDDTVLVCMPFAGGSASAYRGWPEHLGSGVEIVAVQPPGRETRLREAPLRDLGQLIDGMHTALEPVLRDREFAVFGHSLGALLAYEFCRSWRRHDGHDPLCLFAAAREAPSVREWQPPLHLVPDEAFNTELDRRYGGIPQVLREEPDLLELYLPTLRADLEITETYDYRPEEPFGFPLHVLTGRQDVRLNECALAPWLRETVSDGRLCEFDGGHFFLHEAQAEVVRHVRQTIAGLRALRRTEERARATAADG